MHEGFINIHEYGVWVVEGAWLWDRVWLWNKGVWFT